MRTTQMTSEPGPRQQPMKTAQTPNKNKFKLGKVYFKRMSDMAAAEFDSI